ncbi:hypothetical protein [Carboxylicivirga linearis]|uniref:Lipoprotein n=1 Tax=Carboxylicivirga linearis TaxID=1628157 RepID=A0ABS5K2C9_9BACT|nr:hypothetical protein [Carboxylicivirga linearis]MBS2101210.1 hypothetical protein [Carboxylicivirga linearis]
MKYLRIALISNLVLFMVSCQQNMKSKQTEEQKEFTIDTFSFHTSNQKFKYVGERIFPSESLSDSLISNHLLTSEISAIEKVKDSLFVFFNNGMLDDLGNEFFPPVNEKLFQDYYPKFYNVEIDDDIPYFVYLKNSKDLISLIKDNDEFRWESAFVRDTLLSFMNGIKVGQTKNELFEKLGMENIDCSSENLTMIFCHSSRPSKIWFKQLLKGNCGTDQSTTQILLKFENNKIDHIYIDPWICYGNKGSYSRYLRK